MSNKETARVRYLSEAECVRLVNACEPAFRNLVRGAMLTGCRYSELTMMHVADFNADAGVVTVRESKGGKPRHVVLTAEGQRPKALCYADSRQARQRSDVCASGRWRVAQVAPNAADAGKRATGQRSSRRFHFMCCGTHTAQRSPCAACRWGSLPNSSAMQTRE
jgi:integrase